jgi:ABC-type transport system involved in multi-copper enzyme maturation permease subunit
MGFRQLFKKEWKGTFPVFAVYAGLVTLIHLILLYKNASLVKDIAFVFSLLLPTILVGVLAVGTGFYQLQTEWRSNSIYLLLALPVRGWKVLTAKLVAVVSHLVATLCWILLSFSLILLRTQWADLQNEEWSRFWSTLPNLAAHMFWMYLLIVFVLLALVQFTFLCGQLVARMKWLFMIFAFVGSLWLILRISPPLASLLLWTPDIVLGSEFDVLHSGPFLILFLAGVGLIGLNGYIYDKEVEV